MDANNDSTKTTTLTDNKGATQQSTGSDKASHQNQGALNGQAGQNTDGMTDSAADNKRSSSPRNQ